MNLDSKGAPQWFGGCLVSKRGKTFVFNLVCVCRWSRYLRSRTTSATGRRGSGSPVRAPTSGYSGTLSLLFTYCSRQIFNKSARVIIPHFSHVLTWAIPGVFWYTSFCIDSHYPIFDSVPQLYWRPGRECCGSGSGIGGFCAFLTRNLDPG